jgi:hypothetical protein
MALSSNNISYSTIAGMFREKEHGNLFEYRASEDNFADMPHEIFVGSGYAPDMIRYGRVLKTVAYVVVDEDDSGNPVIEKWDIASVWARENRGANYDHNIPPCG